MYEPVIGLEVHVELNTKSKMFCRCSADYFGKKPNTQTCPVCLGLPGSLPYINKQAIEDCMKIGLALNCEISKKSLFERKNYFYPDLAKGYQISQLRWPLCIKGWIEVDPPSHKASEGQETSRIRINRVHQEEDTGKLTHSGSETLIDFNRSSVPLVEIVTEPDFKDSSQIKDYAKKLQQIFRYLGVSDADMEKGQMRLEANISVRKVGQKQLPAYRVELKNINSFRFMVAAVEYEIKRQIEALEKGEKLVQETKGWNEDKKQTFTQRVKEEANDYRYFPEPDLPEMQFEESKIKDLESNLPELPWKKLEQFIEKYGINESSARILTEDKDLAGFFEQLVELGKKEGVLAKDIANYVVNQKIDLLNDSPQQIIDDIKAKKTNLISDDSQLEKVAKEVISENPQMVETYKKGKVTIIQALIGVVMKKTAGKADATKVKIILESLLNL
ncbi:Asp-tRNA(Asn)/Glu-tRNA(Gln) amidotransferase subunit GatB [Candidatus Daviesbacteria bacterium]|nr:Asp-tRNA(Asn)/Glu-tRNA(Gln) amidotransferase subunit GatB [Candidatus Daviesbacteria bacterium]